MLIIQRLSATPSGPRAPETSRVCLILPCKYAFASLLLAALIAISATRPQASCSATLSALPPAPGPRTEAVALGNYSKVLYVSAKGSDNSGNGSESAPWATVAHAFGSITDSSTTTLYAVLVSEGLHAAPGNMPDWVDMYGGFSAAQWSRNLALHPTIFQGSVSPGSHCRVDGCTFSSLMSSGVAATDKTSVTITNNIIANNHGTPSGSNRFGGGIYLLNCSGLIGNNVISGNSIYIFGGYFPPLSVGTADGGGIWCSGGFLIEKNVIEFNSVDSEYTPSHGVWWSRGTGGGICAYGSAVIANNIIYANSAANRVGGIYAENGLIVNNTIMGNRDSGISVVETGGKVLNSIVRDNTAGIQAPDVQYTDFNGAAPTSGCIDAAPVFFSDFMAGTYNSAITSGTVSVLHLSSPTNLVPGALANRVIDADGAAVIIANTTDTIVVSSIHDWGTTGSLTLFNTFHLGSGSRGIDEGTNDGAPANDMDGDARPLQGKTALRADMGADEYVPGLLPTVTPTPTPTMTPTATITPTVTPTNTPLPPGESFLGFHNNHYVGMGDGLTSTLTGYYPSFTIEAWVRRGSATGADIIVGHGKPVADQGWAGQQLVFGFIDANTFVFGHRLGHSAPSDYVGFSTSGDVGAWHHWAATYVGDNDPFVKIYRDGIKVADSRLYDLYENSGNFFIGRSSETETGDAPDWFDGDIDEVRVWNVARTDVQILQTMYSHPAGNASGLVAYWRFNEGFGQIAHDSASAKHDGQLGSTTQADANDPTWLNSGPVGTPTSTPTRTPTRTPTPTPTPVPPIISGLSRANYVIVTNDLQATKKVYIDRDYVFSDPIPSDLYKKTYIRTAMADRDTTTASFLSFQLGAPAKIFIVLDHRITTPPSWMTGWQRYGSSLWTTDPALQRDLYFKRFSIGKITLGPNRELNMPKGKSMYNVIIMPQITGAEAWEQYAAR